MNTRARAGVVAALVITVAVVLLARNTPWRQPVAESAAPQAGVHAASEAPAAASTPPASAVQRSEPVAEPVWATQAAATRLPRLVDLGATRCIPCRMMAPILEELRREQVGRLQVDFIDVWENPAGGREYEIHLIPTQIFFDAAGKEVFRHEGFMSKQDILAKCRELGFDLAEAASPAQAASTENAANG